MPKQITYEIKLKLSHKEIARVEPVRCLLIRLGISSSEIIEVDDGSHKQLSIFKKSKKAAYCLKRELSGLKLKSVLVSIASLGPGDWQTKWKEDFVPFNITKNIRIIPLGKRDSGKQRSKIKVYVGTDCVFGTGLHPTTKFMAEFIEQKKGLFRSFLDIGIGTGILSIIAAKSGAKPIWGVDIRRDAIKVAKRNFQENHCQADYLKATDFNRFKAKKFDFVVANLCTDELIKLRRKIISCVRPGKYLAVSGIYLCNYARFRQKFDHARLRCLRVKKKQGWVALLYKVE